MDQARWERIVDNIIARERGRFSGIVARWVLLLVLAIAGILAQTRQRLTMRRSINETWYAESR